MNQAGISVVIPAFNRVEPLKYTLRSVASAAAKCSEPVEVLVIDDGSSPPLREQLVGFDAGIGVQWLAQANQGPIAARLRGLRAARGDYVLFLDSDDLIHPLKLRRQVAALRGAVADICYADMARATLGPGYNVTRFEPGETLRAVTAPEDFCLRVQPLPHNPVYRSEYLRSALSEPIVPPSREMDPAGDVWLYYNLAPRPARIVKVDGALSAVGPHSDTRYSQQWEKIGIAALAICEAFADRCPRTPSTLAARTTAGECAFQSWRRLPYDFDGRFRQRLLSLWRRAPRGPRCSLGGRGFRLLAATLGPATAGYVLRRARGQPYAASRTLERSEFERLFAKI